jgi:hypothetical protein
MECGESFWDWIRGISQLGICTLDWVLKKLIENKFSCESGLDAQEINFCTLSSLMVVNARQCLSPE